MLFEIVIAFMFVAFCFLALSIYPTSKTNDLSGNNQTPFFNKIIFAIISCIIFFAMAISSASLDYNYCYVNQTTANYQLNATTSTATCASYKIQTLDVSYINYAMGITSLLVIIILIMFAGFANYENKYNGDY